MIDPSATGPVLIGFAESLAAIETAWILLDAGYEVHAFTRRGRRPALGRSPTVRIHEVTSPQVDANRSADDIAALAVLIGAVAVLPLDDDAVWLGDRIDQNTGIVVAGPTGTSARLALDKRMQLELATASGLRVPPTVVVEPGERGSPPDTPGPWVVKPACAVLLDAGRLSRGRAAIASTRSEVAAHVASAAEPFLVQPRIRGTGEGLFGHATGHGVVHWSAHRRIRMMDPKGSGSSACRAIEADVDLLDPAAAFIAAANWHGLFMLEFLRSGDTAWFMELNGRAWGSMVLARRRNLDYPAWTVAAARSPGLAPPSVAAAPPVVARHFGRELVHLAIVLDDWRRGRGIDNPSIPSTVKSLFSWHRGVHWYNYRRGEGRVFVADTWQTVVNKVRATRA